MSCVAYVPARSGSKRLPNKNIKLLAGKPLVVWTLEACVNSTKVDKVIFSTDSKEYWETVQAYISSPKLSLHLRSSDEAGDKVKIFDYLKANYTSIFDDADTKFLLALPTMPFRNEKHVTEAIHLSENTDKPVFSAVEYDFAVSFAFYEVETGWEPVFNDSPMLTGNTRSQDQRVAYHPNGAIYVRNIEDFKNPKLVSFYQDALPIIMNRTESVDIDNEEDFILADALMAAG
ncbi:hypothetical protein NBRC116494_25280 [Aurantivibrio plasticivorans]